jgi:hypothetical protein
MNTVRKVSFDLTDPRLPKMRRIAAEIQREHDSVLYYSWDLSWRYSSREKASAELFCLEILGRFEPTGEQCNTSYDLSEACTYCGDGRKQMSPLVLDLRKIPRSRDITSSYGAEWVVSQRLAELLMAHRMTGFELAPVRHKALYEDDAWDLTETPLGRQLLLRAAEEGIEEGSWEFIVWVNSPEIRPLLDAAHQQHVLQKERDAKRRPKSLPTWYQLKITACVGRTDPRTHFGIDPITDDEAGEFVCPNGHTSGLNLVSEVYLARAQHPGTDFAVTENKCGTRMGVFVPEPEIIVSPRVIALLSEHQMKSYSYSIVHLV